MAWPGMTLPLIQTRAVESICARERETVRPKVHGGSIFCDESLGVGFVDCPDGTREVTIKRYIMNLWSSCCRAMWAKRIVTAM